jgi:hypothetical protein
MFKPLIFALAATMLLVLACGSENGKFLDQHANNHLSFNGRDIAVDSVYCSERMGRVTVRFEQGVLYVSKREEPPGYEAILRFTAPQRSEYANQAIDRPSGTLRNTDGLQLDHDRGVHGEILLMRSMVLLNPDRFPDAAPKRMVVHAACPG